VAKLERPQDERFLRNPNYILAELESAVILSARAGV
jgi:hypothetical protein